MGGGAPVTVPFWFRVCEMAKAWGCHPLDLLTDDPDDLVWLKRGMFVESSINQATNVQVTKRG